MHSITDVRRDELDIKIVVDLYVKKEHKLLLYLEIWMSWSFLMLSRDDKSKVELVDRRCAYLHDRVALHNHDYITLDHRTS